MSCIAITPSYLSRSPSRNHRLLVDRYWKVLCGQFDRLHLEAVLKVEPQPHDCNVLVVVVRIEMRMIQHRFEADRLQTLLVVQIGDSSVRFVVEFDCTRIRMGAVRKI